MLFEVIDVGDILVLDKPLMPKNEPLTTRELWSSTRLTRTIKIKINTIASQYIVGVVLHRFFLMCMMIGTREARSTLSSY